MTLTYLNKSHVDALRKEYKLSEFSLDNIYSKLLLPLWISLLEVEYNILICENTHFTTEFINDINIDELSLLEKWLSLNDYFFKKKYFKRQDREINEFNLGLTNYSRYLAIKNFICNNITPFVEMRNKLAHGQWAVSFNISNHKRNQDTTTKIWKLSKKEIMLIKSIVKNFPPIMKLLIISRTTFERDFDKYMHRLLKAQNDADIKFEWLRAKKTKSNKKNATDAGYMRR